MPNPRIVIEGDAGLLEKAVGSATKKLEEFQKSLPTKSLDFTREALTALGLTLGAGTFIEGIRRAVDSLDKLEESAQSAGVTSVESLQALRYAATFAGVDIEQLDNALAKLSSTLVGAVTGDKKAAEIFRQMGINAQNASGQVLMSDEALAKIADKFASYRDGAEKSALAADLFGQKIGPKLIPLLNNGADGLQRLKDEAEKLGIIFDSKTVRAAALLNDQIDRLKQQTEAAWKGISSSLVPALSKMIEEFNAAKTAAGTLLGALKLLAAQSSETLEDPGAKIRALGEELERLSKMTFDTEGPLRFYAQRAKAVTDERIAEITKELGFLKELQRNRALANAPKDVGDPNLRRFDERSAAPKIDVRPPSNLPQVLADFEQQLADKVRGVVQKNLDETDAAIYDAWTQSAQIRERVRDDIEQSVAGVKRSLGTEQDAMVARFADNLEILRQARQQELITEADYQATRQALEAQHQDALNGITFLGLKQRQQFEQMTMTQQAQFVAGTLQQITAQGAQQSRTLFEINKAAGIANAIVSTYQGAAAALQWGFPLGPIFAAIMVAAGIAQIAQIKNAKFGGGGGGGGGVPSVSTSVPQVTPTSGASPTLPVMPQAAAAPKRVEITMIGSRFSMEDVRDLAAELAEQLDNGVELTVQRG